MAADYTYVTYIECTPERLWRALTDPELTARFWGHSNVSDWQQGSRWEHRRLDGSEIADVTGTVLEAEPPSLLAITFEPPSHEPDGATSTVRFEIERYEDIVRLRVFHEGIDTEENLEAVKLGWPAVAANLKSLLETGHVLPQAPWEMDSHLRDAQLQKNDRG